MEVGAEERGVVVAAVPQDDLGLLLGLAQDALVVDAGVDHEAVVDVGLVLLALLDRGVVAVEVLVGGEALADLAGQVPVRHRVAHRDDLLAHPAQDPRQVAGGLRLADARAHRGDGDHRPARAQHGALDRADAEVRPPTDHPAGDLHHVEVRHVGVGEPHLVDRLVAHDRLELALGADRHAVRVQPAGQLGGVRAPVDVGDLGGRERHHPDPVVAAEQRVEVVEVPSRRPHDDDFPALHADPPSVRLASGCRVRSPRPGTDRPARRRSPA